MDPKSEQLRAVRAADIVVGAVLVTGARAPHVVTADMVRSMQRGSVIVDISVDQGGCVETTKPTTYDAPTYIWEGVTHFTVTNMPGAVPRTSSEALNNATLPFVMQIANLGARNAINVNKHLANGLTVDQGTIAHKLVARDLGEKYVRPEWLTII